jgi:alpha-galactosidase
MFYTGVSKRENGLVQRILSATSDDLVRWRRTDLVLEADSRWYERLPDGAGGEDWRDPWVARDADGRWHMLITARAAHGPLDGRGVIGHASSADLLSWNVHPPITTPGEFHQLEVPQLVHIGGAWRILFSAMPENHSAARLARPGVHREGGTHYLTASGPFGHFRLDRDGFWASNTRVPGYAGRVIGHGGRRWYMAWMTHDDDGNFAGTLTDPLPIDERSASSFEVLPSTSAKPREPRRTFLDVADVRIDRVTASVFEHGWQSWSPTGPYALTAQPDRPDSEIRRLMTYRADRRAPTDAFWGEGLLALDPGDGSGIHVFAASRQDAEIASVRADVVDDRVVVTADGPVTHDLLQAECFDDALGAWAEQFAGDHSAINRERPTLWCSWYQYFDTVTEADVLENLAAIDELDLPIDVVQIDDGYQGDIGDWLTPSTGFPNLTETIARIRDSGRRAGIWAAPFLVGQRSQLAAEHPEWVVGDADAGVNWQQRLGVLDISHRGAADYLHHVFSTFRAMGIDFFKLDFLYAGALAGHRCGDVMPLDAYREGLRLIRQAVGPDSYLLGCGAPILASVGHVDAMRVGPDIGLDFAPANGDMSQSSQRAAVSTATARRWQNGRWWVNDPDCLIARPRMERRRAWADHLVRFDGLRGSSDRIKSLDSWGLETTRSYLAGNGS